MLHDLVFPTCVDSIYFLYLSYKISLFTGRLYQMCLPKGYPFNEFKVINKREYTKTPEEKSTSDGTLKEFRFQCLGMILYNIQSFVSLKALSQKRTMGSSNGYSMKVHA